MITMLFTVQRFNGTLLFLLFSFDFVQIRICTLSPLSTCVRFSDGIDPLQWCRQIIIGWGVLTKPWADENISHA